MEGEGCVRQSRAVAVERTSNSRRTQPRQGASHLHALVRFRPLPLATQKYAITFLTYMGHTQHRACMIILGMPSASSSERYI